MLFTLDDGDEIPRIVRTAFEIAYAQNAGKQSSLTERQKNLIYSNILLAADYNVKHPHYGRQSDGDVIRICCGTTQGVRLDIGYEYNQDKRTIAALSMTFNGKSETGNAVAYLIAALRRHDARYQMRISHNEAQMIAKYIYQGE